MADGTFTRDSFRWTILALISVSHIVGATAQYGINTLAPFYKDELGLSRAQVGLFFSAFYLAMAGFSFGAGWLIAPACAKRRYKVIFVWESVPSQHRWRRR